MMRTRSNISGSGGGGVTVVAGGLLLLIFLSFCLLREKEITTTISDSYGSYLRASSRIMTVLALGGGQEEEEEADDNDNEEDQQGNQQQYPRRRPPTQQQQQQQQRVGVKKKQPQQKYSKYVPSPIESYIVTHMEELNLTKKSPELVTTCHLWTDPSTTPYHSDMIDFLTDLEQYYKRIEDFTSLEDDNITDLRLHLRSDHDDNNNEDDNDDSSSSSSSSICNRVDLVEIAKGGLPSLFPNEKLSYTSAGYVEPLLPPMRHPRWCLQQDGNIMASIEYLVHDFGHLCRQMKRTSRIVLFDLGSTLYFGAKRWPSPVLYLTKLYRKFGFPFDHIYAWELNRKDPNVLWKEELPSYMDPSYHFINVGVEADPQSRQNPFKLLLDYYNEDDIIIFKLDIDSPAIERKLVDQLLNEPRLLKLIDHFYFEHHVNQKELRPYWGLMEESVEESFTIFHELRKKGLAAHFWN